MGDSRKGVLSHLRRVLRAASGQAVVELALVMPVFLILLVGIFDLAQILYFRHILDKASREGARVGVTETDTQSAVDTAYRWCSNILQNHKVDGACNAAAITVASVEGIKVDVNYDYPPFFSEGRFAVIPSIRLHSSSTMRKEG